MAEQKKKPRTKSVKQLEAQLQKTKEREARIKQQISKKKAKERKDAKKWHDNAKIQIGGIVLKYLDATWLDLDPDKFEAQFKAIAPRCYGGDSAHPVFCCKRETALEPVEARDAWADFQSRKQHEAAEARKARTASKKNAEAQGASDAS